jgi:predicted ATPase
VIASVAFRNFRALRSTSLALAPFNLVIGPNGSGKTSLIQALLRLRALAKLPPAVGTTREERKGGPAAEAMAGKPEIVFQFSPPHEAITARMSCVSDYVCDLLQITPADAPGWPALRDEVAQIRSYLLDHYAMAEPAARTNSTKLASNGGNLAAVLAQLRTTAPGSFAGLVAEAVRIMPEFSAVELGEREDSACELALRLAEGGELVTAENLAQGALYLLAVLALSFDPAPPALLCIEEIDRGIHPRLLREMRDALYRLSHPAAFGLAQRPVQIIATTHSPYMLDLFREHPGEIVLAHKRGREARFERLADRADLAELLREGSLGDMWFSGILGGVPEEQ